MDTTAISNLSNTNLAKSSATDRIDDIELRAVIAAILSGESTVTGDNTGVISFQSTFGTIYTATQTNASLTVSAPGDNIGWEIFFKHNAASITLTDGTDPITILNPDSYIPSEENYLRAWVEDTGVIYAEVIALKQVKRVGSGDTSLEAGAGFFFVTASGVAVATFETDSSKAKVDLGDVNTAGNGVMLSVLDDGQAVEIRNTAGTAFTFSLSDGSLTIASLADTEADGPAVKMVGVDANGKLVKQAIPSGGGTTDLTHTASPTTVTVESSTGNNTDLPLATPTDAGLLSPTDKTKLDATVEIDGTAVVLGDILGYNGTQFARDPFVVNDSAGADISCSSIKGSIYGGTLARTEAAITISDSIEGGSAMLRLQNATAGGPTFTFTGGGTVIKVGDWPNGYSTSDVNHISLVAVSTSLVYAYLAGTE